MIADPWFVPMIGLALTGAAVAASLTGDARRARTRRREEMRLTDAAETERRRREAEATAEREREHAAVVMEQQRSRRRRRIDSYGMTEFLRGLLLQHPWAGRAEAISADRTAADADIAAATIEKDARHAELDASPIGGNRSLAIGSTLLWLGMSGMLLFLDWELLRSYGPLAGAIAAALTTVIEMLGMVVWSALGVHAVPLIASAGRSARIAVGMLAAVAFASLLSLVMLPLAANRAEELYGDSLRSARSVLAAAELDGDPAEVAAAQLALEDIKGRFDGDVLMNQGITAGLALGVLVLSWAPFVAVEHRRLRLAERRLDASHAQRQAVDAEQGRFDADFTDYAATMLDDLDLNSNDVRLLLADPRAAPDELEARDAPLPPPTPGVDRPRNVPHADPPGAPGADPSPEAFEPPTLDELPNPFDLFPEGPAHE